MRLYISRPLALNIAAPPEAGAFSGRLLSLTRRTESCYPNRDVIHFVLGTNVTIEWRNFGRAASQCMMTSACGSIGSFRRNSDFAVMHAKVKCAKQVIANAWHCFDRSLDLALRAVSERCLLSDWTVLRAVNGIGVKNMGVTASHCGQRDAYYQRHPFRQTNAYACRLLEYVTVLAASVLIFVNIATLGPKLGSVWARICCWKSCPSLSCHDIVNSPLLRRRNDRWFVSCEYHAHIWSIAALHLVPTIMQLAVSYNS